MAITKATASSIAPAAKGDLVVGSATNDAAVLAVGTNDYVLTADSSTTTGLKWAAASSGALTKIVSTTMSAVASQDFLNCFSGTYRSYLIEFSNIFDSGAVASPTVNLNFYYSTNTDIGNGRYYGGMFGIGPTGASATALSTSGAASWAFGRTAGAGAPSGGFLNISAAGSLGGSNTEYKNFAAQGQWMQCGEDYRSYVGGFNGNLNQAITGFKISLSGGNISGTITVYGYQN